MILVTKPFIPPKEEYDVCLNGIWKHNWLNTHGPLFNDLELRWNDYLDVDHLLFLTNGTPGPQIAIKALDLSGEVIPLFRLWPPRQAWPGRVVSLYLWILIAVPIIMTRIKSNPPSPKILPTAWLSE